MSPGRSKEFDGGAHRLGLQKEQPTMIIQSADKEFLNMDSVCLEANEHSECEPSTNRKISLATTPEDEPVDIYKTSHDGKYGFVLPPSRTPLKLLLVFPNADTTFDAIKRAAEKLAFEISHSATYDAALEEYQTIHHDLVFVDSRAQKLLDYDTLCRSIRNSKGGQNIVTVSIVKRSLFEKDDSFVMSQLESGFNRCLMESSNTTIWLNELIQLKSSDCRTSAQMATTQILYEAINGSKDAIIVTDDVCRMQFANDACERLLGFRQDEIVGKTLHEQLVVEPLQIGTMTLSLTRGRTWNGVVGFKRKANDSLTMNCKAIPITCAGRLPTHFLIIIDPPGNADVVVNHNTQSRGSINSIRKGSVDLKPDYRRTSLAKLPLEAPITKIMNLIYDAMQNSNSQTCSLLEKAVEMLKCTELYSPSVKEDALSKSEEPVATDLIGALLTNSNVPIHNVNSRRSSNDSSIFRVSKGVIKMKNQPSSNHIDRLLENFLDWNFDIFRLEDLTEKRSLLFLGLKIFTHFDVASTLQIDETTLSNWLLKIEANYHKNNFYHNSTHAADVMQAVAGFLEKDRMKDIMDPMDEATALIAAAAHDVDHPGKSSAFLSNSSDPLAILYNDVTVLESHHSALTFKLTLGDPKCNIFKNLDRDSYKIARYNVIDMILATEMTKHFEHLAKFVNVFCSKTGPDDPDGGSDAVQILQAENITLVKRIMIKCADVSNPTRPMAICLEWSRRIAEEYFQQTDDEKMMGLPVVMPMFDRTTCSIPKSQVGFIDFIINDMIDAWNAFINMPELITNMRHNYLKWKELDEQGYSNSEDLKKALDDLIAHKWSL
ncbi:PREDICTED: high affinity cAMP-specific and IBMX-insensitive 3',5'-cyclic phosphodiesterase 8A isoform X2 [Nicrophorus vespilloides]|uniref:3',5'-cyclic-AMP phosphodiesterase n=1 Tax=Nicrophorus vespilloides TaxID=110193 RepID=A0ABM1MKX0_NICVS|nr:PREDICTED: high affinity cAMP-specific and IBMX-insensitive 3',5'-cyclic phosphodiesterase 8A isoform X2 [Nicrophorus vespilloides]XP_017775219.1 PREDICTED: high affinity cAMP-specific and IBMX-insensitive 3',5'-cyclic phosphodiesterase 8A isoform X2 [Nicrophorus vespilloides]XP_017775220.1 PREDICTED: high affinity cAMP-specific and IBMX-insensitive 3',5'-cyclic phosphodiesterase 8A isoform X2 [Nicrophorus vespilloides]